MKISQECIDYELHVKRQRKNKPTFPIQAADLITYIKYRGRNNTFCKFLSNLQKHPLHGKKWLDEINNDKNVKEVMEKYLKIWNIDLREFKVPLIGVRPEDMPRSFSNKVTQQQPPPLSFVPQERGAISIVPSNNIDTLSINQKPPQPQTYHASLLPVMSVIRSLEEEPVKIAKNPITNYFKKTTPQPRSPLPSLHTPSQKLNDSNTYPISSTPRPKNQPPKPSPKYEYIPSSALFGIPTSDEEDFMQPVITVKLKSKSRKRKRGTDKNEEELEPINQPSICIETWDPDRMADNLMNYVDMEHFSQIEYHHTSSRSLRHVKPGESSSSTIKRVPIVLAASDDDDSSKEESVNSIASRKNDTSLTPKLSVYASQSTRQWLKEEEWGIDFDGESSFMEYKNGCLDKQEDVKGVIVEEKSIEVQEEDDYPDEDGYFRDDFYNPSKQLEEMDTFASQPIEPNDGYNADSDTEDSSMGEEWHHTTSSLHKEKETSLVLHEESSNNSFESLYDKDFDQDVYEEYLEIMNQQEKLALEKGARIVAPNLRVLSHIVIERSFR